MGTVAIVISVLFLSHLTYSVGRRMKGEGRPVAKHRFFMPVHGITDWNADGSRCRKIIRDCYEGEVLSLVPEPDSRYHPPLPACIAHTNCEAMTCGNGLT